MRLLALLSLVCFCSLSGYGQGYERELFDLNPTRIWEINPLDENRLEIVYIGHYNYSFLRILRYNSQEDSLGRSFGYRSTDRNYTGELVFGHSFKRDENHRLYYSNSLFGPLGRYAIYLELQNFIDTLPTKRISPPYFSPSFNPLLVNDTIYAYRGENMDYRHSQVFTRNDTLIRYYFDFENDTIQFLDTVFLPYNIEFPGSLQYLPATNQNVLILDSLKIYLSPGKPQADSIVVRPQNAIWDFELPYFNHYRSTVAGPFGIRKFERVKDTLKLSAIDYYDNLLGERQVVTFPKVETSSFSKSNDRSLLKLESDSALSLGFYDRFSYYGSHSGITLIRMKEGQIKRMAYYAAPAELPNYTFDAISSDGHGNFYLGASYSFDGPFFNKQSILIKLDSNNFSRPVISQMELDFELFHTKDNQSGINRVYFVLANHQDFCHYKISDAQGKLYAEGRARSREFIEVNRMRKGAYYLSLWLGDVYLGSKPMIVW